MSRRINWTPEFIALLGKVPDAELAEKMGCSVWRVGVARRSKGIPAHRKSVWTAEKEMVLGKAFDCEVAQRLGISKNTVLLARKAKGILRYRKYVLSPENFARLGTVSDRDLAKEIGCTESYIVAARHRHGIPAFQTQREWTPDELALLGVFSDRDVAERVGRSIAAVRAAKRSLGDKRVGRRRHPFLSEMKREYTTTMLPEAEIASKYGVSTKSIKTRARNSGWKRPDPALAVDSQLKALAEQHFPGLT